MVEERLHVDAESFIVTVDACPVRGFASHPWATDSGEDGGDDLVAEGEQGGDGAGCLGRGVLAAGAAWLDGEALAAQLAQVVGRLAGGCSRCDRHR